MIWLTLGVISVTVVLLNCNFWTIICFLLIVCRVWYLDQRKLWWGFIIILIVTAGNTLYHQSQQQTNLDSNKNEWIVNVSMTDVEIEGNQVHFTGDVVLSEKSAEKVEVFYYLSSETEKKEWLAQTESFQVKIFGELNQPDEERNLGSFNYRQFLWRRQEFWILNAKQIIFIQPLRQWKYQIANFKYAFLRRFETIANPQIRAYILSLFFNELEVIDSNVLAAYQTIGMIHLFSISGFHVTYLVKQMKRLLLPLGLTVEVVDFVVLGLLFAYCLLLNFPYGLIRAFGAYLYNWWQRRRGNPPSTLNGTCLTLMICLWWQPYALFSLSWQLTYLLAAVVLFMNQSLTTYSWPNWMKELMMSFGCLMAIVPILVSHFYQFSWLALILNVFYSFIFTVFLFPGLLLLMGLHLVDLANYLEWFQALLAWVIRQLERLSLEVVEWDIFHWVTGQIPAWLMGIIVIVFISYFLAFESQKHLKVMTIIIGSVLMILWAYPYLNPNGVVQMVDIGQGDTFLIKLPHMKKVYLIDVAEKPHFAKENWEERETSSMVSRQLIPSLKAQGIRKINGVFITHGDYDHMGGFDELSQHYPIDNVYLPIGMQADTTQLATLADSLQQAGQQSHIHWLKTGDTIRASTETSFHVLNPHKKGTGENEDSLVLYAEIGPRRFLFTGDVEDKNEQRVQQMIQRLGLKIDILKVAHHGSGHSTPSEFVETIKPKQAWISVGENNRYGHPNQEVLKSLQQSGAEIYRTDKMGGIYYHFRKGFAKIETTAQNWEES